MELLYRHVKTGRLYRYLLQARLEGTGEDMVVYQSINTGAFWVRPASEFFDGRFIAKGL